MKRAFMLGALLVTVLGLVATSAVADPGQKVIVCKYVGTPGVDETLQTGDNPIQVSENAIPGFTGSFTYEFADAQGRSLAIRFAANNRDRGDISECTAPQGPPVEPPVPPVPPVPSVPPVEPPVLSVVPPVEDAPVVETPIEEPTITEPKPEEGEDKTEPDKATPTAPTQTQPDEPTTVPDKEPQAPPFTR